MKTYKDLLLALREDKALRAEAVALKDTDYAAIVAFGKAHGYEFTEEDIHFQHAADRPLDDAEMELVGGGIDIPCSLMYRCMYNSDCKGNAYADCFGDDYCSDNASGHCRSGSNSDCSFGFGEYCRMGADH